ELIDQSFAELEQLAAGLAILRELTPRTTDYLIARGERLTARLVAAALAAADCPCAYVDAVDVVRTDGTFGAASADLKLTERRARRALRPLLARGVVPIVPGFLGAAPDGQVATLGRGGSDPTALGTEISRRRTLESYPVKALSAIPGQALLTVTGSGMLGVPGIAARTFAAVREQGISVSLISQASSEHSICFSVPNEHAER